MWRPIETAPKDGPRVILLNLMDGKAISGYWRQAGYDYDAGWVENLSVEVESRKSVKFKPTHWMPLPDPPQGQG